MKDVNPVNVFMICATVLLFSAITGGYIYKSVRIKHLTENGYEQRLIGSYTGWVKSETKD